METIRERILAQLGQHPGGVNAIHVQTAIKRRIDSGEDERGATPPLSAVVGELETMAAGGVLKCLPDAPGANLRSTRIYVRAGAGSESE